MNNGMPLDNWDEMENFPERHKLSKLTSESIISKQIEWGIKNYPQRKNSSSDGFTSKFN